MQWHDRKGDEAPVEHNGLGFERGCFHDVAKVLESDQDLGGVDRVYEQRHRLLGLLKVDFVGGARVHVDGKVSGKKKRFFFLYLNLFLSL